MFLLPKQFLSSEKYSHPMFVYSHKKIVFSRRPNISLIRISVFIIMLIWCIGFLSPAFNSDFSLASFPLLNLIYSKFCHQDSAKSFYINGNSLLVCARCTGIYLGILAGIFSLLCLNIKFKIETIKPLILLSLPMLLDVTFYNIGLYGYSKIIAFSTGLLFGTVTIIYLDNFIEKNMIKRTSYE